MNSHQPDYAYMGGMRIIECLRHGKDIRPVLDTLYSRVNQQGGAEVFSGALQCVFNQYWALRRGGCTFSCKDPVANRFLNSQLTEMALELNHLSNGGDSTRKNLETVLSVLATSVWNSRHMLKYEDSGRVAK